MKQIDCDPQNTDCGNANPNRKKVELNVCVNVCVYVCVYVCVRESVCVSKKRGRKKLLKIL